MKWQAHISYRTILFLFYFNRGIGAIISVLIRTYTWHYYRAYIDIQAIQISLLGGRLFFKGFRYHGENETILIGDGYITWRYWLRRVRVAELSEADRSNGNRTEEKDTAHTKVEEGRGGPRASQGLPCRITAKVRGVEWFVYNRSPAYDSIVAAMLKVEETNKVPAQDSDSSHRNNEKNIPKSQQNSSAGTSEEQPSSGPYKREAPGSGGQINLDDSTSSGAARMGRDTGNHFDRNADLPALLSLLPIRIDCSRGALVMGNEHTRCVLVAKFGTAHGFVNALPSGPHDRYRQSSDINFEQPMVQLRPNTEFHDSLLVAGGKLSGQVEESESPKKRQTMSNGLRRRKRAAIHSVYDKLPFLRGPMSSFVEGSVQDEMATSTIQPISDSGQHRWLGLSRYLDDDDDEQVELERWKAIEYGQVTTIADCPTISMNFFWDIPGPVVPDEGPDIASLQGGFEKDINGCKPPEWGLDLRISGGVINYGPWADRQRTDLQAVFFPSPYIDSSAASLLNPGQLRVNSAFKVIVVIEKEVVLRIHTREESKDWKWKDYLTKATDSEKHQLKKNPKAKKGEKLNPEVRQPGWLDLTVAADSCVTYSMDMVASDEGFRNTLELDLKSPHMSTSVNHDLMWRSKSVTLSCDLSNPLGWNALRSWNFDVMGDRFELFVLRDHAFLLTDLVNDWTSGPPGEYLTFVPFIYKLNIHLTEFRLYLNVNDSNIINNPSAVDDNTFIILNGERLDAVVTVPLKVFRPLENKVTIDIDSSDLFLELNAPNWNTLRTFHENEKIGILEELQVRGSYNYCTSTSTSLTDTVLLDVKGKEAMLQLYGFLIRYLMIFKDNYFGEDLHFQTLEEHQQQIASSNSDRVRAEEHRRLKVTNDLDLILTLAVDDAHARVPARLYSAEEYLKLDMTLMSLDLRFTNYYMDLEVAFSPLVASQGRLGSSTSKTEPRESSTQAFVDGITISGHRLFGLPPSEPTYVCNWDFEVGRVFGECSIEFLACLISSAKCFAFQFVDAENALPRHNPLVLHDITFLRAHIMPIKVWLHLGQAAFLLSTDAIILDFNDWAGERFSERLHATISRMTFASIDTRSASHSSLRGQSNVVTHAYLNTSLDLRMVESKADFNAKKQLQQSHVELHDSRTHRTPWLLHEPGRAMPPTFRDPRSRPRPPTMPIPPMPEPVTGGDSPYSKYSNSLKSSVIGPPSDRQSSFLSLDSAGSRKKRKPSSASLISQNSRKEDGIDLASGAPPTGRLSPGQPRSTGNLFSPQNRLQTAAARPVPSRVTFSSPYEVPYFPLMSAEPNVEDVPLTDEAESSREDQEEESFDSETISPVEDDVTHTTFIISLDSGVNALFTPRALILLNELVSTLQPTSVENVLDELQVRCISNVVSRSGTEPPPKTTQLRVDMPHAAIRFQDRFTGDRDATVTSQSYDLASGRMKILLRQKNEPATIGMADASQLFALQGSLGHLKCIAIGGADREDDACASIEVALDGLSLWAVKGKRSVCETQFRGLDIVSHNRKVESMTKLLNASMALSHRLLDEFQNTALEDKRRLQSLILNLSTSHQDLPDASFMTSASYVLRAAAVHPRGSDSWKMISRLRYIYKHYTLDERQILAAFCLNPPRDLPRDAKKRTITSFRRWRGWDMSNISDSSLVQETYGSDPLSPDQGQLRPISPVEFSLEAGLVHFIIDPGPEQNEVQLVQLATAVHSGECVQSMDNGEPPTSRDTTVKIMWDEALIALNWEMCELASGVMEQFKDAPVPTSKPLPPSHRPQTPNQPQFIHLIVSGNYVDASLKSINLRTRCLVQTITSSAIAKYTSPDDAFVTFIVNSEAVVAEVSSEVKPIMQSRLQQPSIHGSLESLPTQENTKKTWKASAICSRLVVDIREDILGLLGVVDRFFTDELAYVMGLVARGRSRKPTSDSPKKPASSRGPQAQHTVDLSFLLESFTISTVLLSSLRYVLHGQTARSSAKSGMSGLGFIIDFDLTKHAHAFENQEKKTAQKISTLPMPTINGRICLTREKSSNLTDVSMAFEKIVLDASSIHAVLSTMSRREISTLKKYVARDIDLVKSNYVRALSQFARREDRSKAEPPTVGLTKYAAKLTISGLTVKATTGRSSNQPARLALELGWLKFAVSNKSSNSDLPLTFPEINAGISEARIVLQRLHRGDSTHCGDVALAVSFLGTSKRNDQGQLVRSISVNVDYLVVNLYTETASMIVDILGYLQQRLKSFSLSDEINTFRARRLRSKSQALSPKTSNFQGEDGNDVPTILFNSMYALDVHDVQLSWRVGDLAPISPGHEVEDLVFSIDRFNLATSKANAARLVMNSIQLQMVPKSQSMRSRSRNSALMPEVIFNIAYLSTPKDRRFAFQAVGKSVDLRLTTQFVLPASDLQRSITQATRDLRAVIASWNASFIQDEQQNKKILGNKKLSSVLVDVDFAGAVVYFQGRKLSDPESLTRTMLHTGTLHRTPSTPNHSQEDGRSTIVLRTPGIAVKVEYKNVGNQDPSLNAEIKVNASSNTLQHAIVPLILELSASVKEIVEEQGQAPRQPSPPKASPTKVFEGDILQSTDPAEMLGNTRLNLGLRICKQEFGLSCQPIAKVAASAQSEDLYMTMNTVQLADQSRFFAVSAVITGLQASLQHAYSRESTGSFEVDSIELSLMNSKHVSNVKGISAILKISPTKVMVNAKQLHDFLLFREIWIPVELRKSTPPSAGPERNETHPFGVQRYQQVAAANAFPWNAAVSVEKLDVSLDLGQAIGKSSFTISQLWVSSKKHSDREQNLCLGFDTISLGCVGRVSCALDLQRLRLRTSIYWPSMEEMANSTPLVQASLGFDDLRMKAAFEYQAFFVADFSSLEFLMYNVRDDRHVSGDRLACVVNGDKVQAYITTQSSAQALSVFQAFQRLIQEKQQAFKNSLKDIERYYRGRSSSATPVAEAIIQRRDKTDMESHKTPVQLQTNVVVNLGAINLGVYPKSFYEPTIFKLEALDVSATFSVTLDGQEVQSGLGLSLGQVRVALSNVARQAYAGDGGRTSAASSFEDMAVDEIIRRSTGSRGGTILKVPRVVASMRTRQRPGATEIQYVFRSAFEGRVEVGWNISRVNIIRRMWEAHSQALAQRLGKALPQSAVQITGVPRLEGEGPGARAAAAAAGGEDAAGGGGAGGPRDGREKEKITAVVNVPQSKYTYTALEPPIIEAPQLRDMGEATPPLEWIGLQRDRLPHVTHQIVIVPLLEVAREVEDAYSRILGTS